MNKDNVLQFEGRETMTTDALTQLLKSGAQQMLQVAIEVEVQEFMLQFQDRLLADGRAAVVRNGHQPERDLQTGIGPVTVKVPKVRSRDGEPVTFRSALVPPYVRKTKSLEAALPWLYLKGVSTGEMGDALVAIGMPVARHPSHRSRRALLTHRAPTLSFGVKASLGIRMLHFNRWKEDRLNTMKARPRHDITLASAPERT